MKTTVFVIGCRRKKDKARLEKIIRCHKDPVTVRRALVVRSSIEGLSVPQISRNTGLSHKTVRGIIHQFNREGFASLWHYKGGGRPRRFTEAQKEEIVELSQLKPRDFGLPVNRWTLSLLAEKAQRLGIVETISHEWVRQILRRNGISIKRTKTWKEPKDPQCWKKWKRIKRLYRRCPKNAAVICFDEMGPFSIRPVHGRSYAPTGKPDRLPADYHRDKGISYLLACYDVHRNWLSGILVRRRTKHAIFSFLKSIRSSYPAHMTLYIVLDNLNLHKAKEIAQWARRSKVVLVYTAVNASWMNRIESQFAAIKENVIANSYYESHKELWRAIRKYLTWRNRRASRKEKPNRKMVA